MAEADQLQQPPVTPPVEPPQDAPPAPVVVDIDSGTAVEQPAAAAPPPPPQAPKPKPRHEVRIQTLAHERDEARGFANKLQQELEVARREAAEARAAREQAERSGMNNYAARVDADVAAAKAALKAAKDNKDDDAEIEAQAQLAKATAQQADVDAWRATQPKEGERREPAPRAEPEPRQQQQPRPEPLAEPVREFIKDNPWFNPVQIGDDGLPVVAQNGQMVSNPGFDPEMHDAAILEDKKIQREIRMGRLPANYMHSPEYFGRIAARVEIEFPDAFEQESDDGSPPIPPSRKTPPMAPSRQPVAPAQRQSQPGTPPKQGTKLTLDGEQADFVRKLVDNGTMSYPRNHPDPEKRGKKMSYNDAYVEYAQKLKNDPGSQQGRQ